MAIGINDGYRDPDGYVDPALFALSGGSSPPASGGGAGGGAPAAPARNIGPTEMPATEHSKYPDVYIPPYDEANPKKQCRFRYDPKTESYVAIARYDPVTGWKDFDKAEFIRFNQGNNKIKGDVKEKKIKDTTYLTLRDPESNKEVIVGVKIGDQEIFLPNTNTAARANEAKARTLPAEVPKENDKVADIYMPPINADGTAPSPQYILRKDPASDVWFCVGEYKDGRRIDYDDETFRKMNEEYEYNTVGSDVPPPDKEHRDFTARGSDGKLGIYRWFPEDGKYKLAGFMDGDNKVMLSGKAIAVLNQNHTPPHSPSEVNSGDFGTAGSEPFPDKFIPPYEEGKKSIIFRYHRGTDSYYAVGEYDEKGEQRMYAGEDFKRHNPPLSKTDNPPVKPHKDDYENDQGLIVRKDKEGNVKIVGMKINGSTYYLDKKRYEAVNSLPVTSVAKDEKDPPFPTGTPPKAGESAKDGHLDFNSKGPGKDEYTIWRWDKTVGRYCAVGHYKKYGDKDDTDVLNFKMFTNEEYREKNSGPNRLKPPAKGIDFKPPEYAKEDGRTVNEHVKEDERINLFDAPDPPDAKGKAGAGYPFSGHPIYRTLANGERVIVGIRVKASDDGRMKEGSRDHYFNQQEFEYFNPGGKPTTDKNKLHMRKWSPTERNVVDPYNNPSYDTLDKTAPPY